MHEILVGEHLGYSNDNMARCKLSSFHQLVNAHGGTFQSHIGRHNIYELSRSTDYELL